MDIETRLKAIETFLQTKLAYTPPTDPIPTPVDPIAGFVKVAKENETVDFGSTVTDVAYGANGKFALKKGVSGKVTFNNANFGDPIPNNAKAGYAKVAPPVIVTPTPPTNRLNGTISDAGTAELHAPFFKELGFNSIRIWMSFDDNGDVTDEKIAKINNYFNLGITPRVCFTPWTNKTAVPAIPQKAIDRIIAKMDKRVQINIINEANLTDYWPKGDWKTAFKFAHEVAGKLKAAGFKCGSPSLTGWVENWESWWAECNQNGWLSNFDVACFHIYPNANAQSNPTGWLSLFKTMATLAKKIGDKYGKKVDIDEWGFGKNVSDDTMASLLPEVQKALNANTDASAYFIISRSGTAAAPKDPHDYFNWAIDFKTGERREKVVAAFKAVK